MTLALNASYEKITIAMRHYLLGRRFFDAIAAMELAGQYHTGMRKDGTPEFSHQVWQSQYIRTLEPSLDDPEGTLITTFLHDLLEDYADKISYEYIVNKFGQERGASVWAITKIRNGVKIPDTEYYDEMAADLRAAVAKGGDRIHNHQSMNGAFTPEKQESYMVETETHVLPMLKKARRLFPTQDAAYENIKHVLLTQMELIRAIHA